MRNGFFIILILVISSALGACSSVTEEHIAASADQITFSRSTGKHAASGGFKLTKDSLVMRESK